MVFCRSRTGLLVLYVELIFISLPAVLCGCLYNNPDEIELTVSAPPPPTGALPPNISP